MSAISAVANTYSQNHKTLDAYYDCLDNNALPTARGIRLGMDDLLRRFIIQRLMCNFELSMASIEQAYAITFTTYFASELAQLRSLESDGLLSIEGQWINVASKGRLLIRTICMVFDRYLGHPAAAAASSPLQAAEAAPVAQAAQFSRTI